MAKYHIFVTARAEAEHHCDCEACTLKRIIEISASWEAIIDVESDKQAETQAEYEITAQLEDKAPLGYWIVDATVQITADVRLLDDIAEARLLGYPTLPGFEEL